MNILSTDSFFYNDSVDDFERNYLMRFGCVVDCSITINKKLILQPINTELYCQNRKYLLLFESDDYLHEPTMGKFYGYLNPLIDETGIYGVTEFFEDDIQNIHDEGNIKYEPFGTYYRENSTVNFVLHGFKMKFL